MEDGTIYDFFDVKLQNLIRRKYNIYLPVVTKDEEVKGACIIHRDKGESGDEYSGRNYYGEVELMNFSLPNGTPLKIYFSYNWHSFSGQADNWSISANGVPEQDLNDFKRIFNIGSYNFYQGNYMTPDYTINGKESDAEWK